LSQLKRKLRRIATIRNKLIHDVDYNAVENRDQFRADVREAASELELIAKSKGYTTNCVVM
jgi:hypothetical protein